MKSDQHLMKMICKGSHPAFTELVQRHSDRFYVLSYRTLNNRGDAEDIVQSAFIKLWQNPHSWNADKSKFTTWFYRVILNACHDFQRKHKRNSLADIETIARALEPTQSEQSFLESKQYEIDRERRLQTAFKQLPTAQRDALNLVYYCAMPQAKAAEVLGMSLKALESALLRAKKTLSNNVTENNQSNVSSPPNGAVKVI